MCECMLGCVCVCDVGKRTQEQEGKRLSQQHGGHRGGMRPSGDGSNSDNFQRRFTLMMTTLLDVKGQL